MLVGDIFTTEIVAPTDIVIIHGKTVPPEQYAIRVTERVIAGIPVISKVIVVMTIIHAPLTLVMGTDGVKTLTHVRFLALVTGREVKQAILVTPAVFVHNTIHSVVIRIANIVILIVQVVALIVASVITAPSITAPAVRIMKNIFSVVPQVIIIMALGRNVIMVTFAFQAHVIKDADY